jgi:predicted Mrr-cat superfamily restriction endonuclease
VQSVEPKLFILRLDHRLERSLKENVIGLGWWRADQLSQIDSWPSFKEHIREKYLEYYQNEHSLGNAAGSVWRFIKSMKTGDRVIVPVPGAFYVAQVTSDVFYDPSGANDDIDYAYRREVVWVTDKSRPVPRNHGSGALQRWMKARQTCVEVEEGLVRDLDEAVSRKAPVDFGNAVLEAAYVHVAKALRDAINDQGLEKIVRRLAIASGARAWIPPKNSGLPGDADVIAEYDLGIAASGATIEVAYQVKQHKGRTAEWGVQQLILRMDASPSIVRGCMVTTAQSVSEEAKKLADQHDILILTEAELVQWVLSVGLGALSRYE